MSPGDVPELLCKKSEPYRKPIGWFSILAGIAIATMLTAIATVEHWHAEAARAKMAEEEANISRLEDSIRDAISLSDRPIIVYHAGEAGKGDERFIAWPKSAEALLGWTLEDISDKGIAVLMDTDELRLDWHQEALEKALETPPGQRNTVVVHCKVRKKCGDIIPVRIAVWVVGNKTRSILATIEAESNVVELFAMSKEPPSC